MAMKIMNTGLDQVEDKNKISEQHRKCLQYKKYWIKFFLPYSKLGKESGRQR